MSTRTIIMIVLAVAFGLSAAVAINLVLGQGPANSAVETVPVVVAAVDINTSQLINADNVRLRDWPKDLVPKGAFSNVEEALERMAINRMVAEEPVLDSKLAAKGVRNVLAQIIPDGMRAHTIMTPTIAVGVAGLILPGNRVDVILTTRSNANDDTGGGSAIKFLQNLEVVAVNQSTELSTAAAKPEDRDLRSVTLKVTPRQADKLTLGQNMGTLHLSLRGQSDNGIVNTPPLTVKQIASEHDPDALVKMFAALMNRPNRAPETVQSAAAPAATPAPATNKNSEIRTLRHTTPGLVVVEPRQ